MSDLSEQIKSKFDSPTSGAHSVVRQLLWLLYPTEKNVDVDLDETHCDEVSDQNAAFILDGLALKGFTISQK